MAINSILVTGDVLTDCNVYEGKRMTPGSRSPLGTRVVYSRGGAGLLFDIVRKLAVKKAAEDRIDASRYTVRFDLDLDKADGLSTGHHSYAFWRPCPREAKSTDHVWRMVRALGYGEPSMGQSGHQLRLAEDRLADPRIVVLDDGGLGFRSDINKDFWPLVLKADTEGALKWVIVKMSGPLGKGDLFRELSDRFADRLIIVVSINDVRREEVGISKGLSWERTSQDLITGLNFNPTMHKLMNSNHLIVSFGSEGALWVDNRGGKPEYNLVFDPACMESEWAEQLEGSAFGTLSCLTAGIVNQLTMPEDKMSMQDGIMSGLLAIRRLQLQGHGDIQEKEPAFPFGEVVEEILKRPTGYSCVGVFQSPGKPGSGTDHWTIMGGAHQGDDPHPLCGLSRRVALFGPKELSDIPYSRFGKLFTVDRSEIESLRGIQYLIKDYEAKKSPKKPLSIAVFGPPGSGKSFGIKQIAKSVMGDDVPILEFNLSQFTGPEELTDAFHQVRDMVLKGDTPCVFWDEFDSREYLWLQYLLAPMQDGEFRQGQLVHPIGKCIFVFAGGTSYDMENFGPSDRSSEAFKNFKMLKGPDFASRLNGYLNVLGPNKRQVYDRDSKGWIDDRDPADICFPVRRALLMRVMLKHFGDERLRIDSGLLTAFIEIDKYKHGARSMETILLLSRRAGANELRRSDLPPREQMSLHVDYDAFMGLVNRDLPFKMDREAIAPSVHDFYRKLGTREGWIRPEMDQRYSDLSDDIKEDNLAAAERIPEVLSLAGLEIVGKEQPGKPLSSDDYQKLLENSEDLERLAEAEHNGWMEFKRLNGWQYDPIRNDDEKKHDLLVPFHKLSEENKDKDRNSVRSYFEILDNAGYRICLSK